MPVWSSLGQGQITFLEWGGMSLTLFVVGFAAFLQPFLSAPVTLCERNSRSGRD